VGGPPFADWTKVGGDGLGSPINNTRINSMAIYDGDLYAGTANFDRGCQVWKSTDGINWTRVGTQGFGDSNNTVASWMISYNGQRGSTSQLLLIRSGRMPMFAFM